MVMSNGVIEALEKSMRRAQGIPDAIMDFVKQFCQPGKLVFDVGANIGEKTKLFLACGANVICIEPQPDCVTQLERRFAGSMHVIIEAVGLSDKQGMLDMQICSQANTISTFSEKWKTGRFSAYSWDKIISVNVTTLDALIDKYGIPTYCKIDVEGFEYQVIKGLSKPIPYLSFEFTTETKEAAFDCITYLLKLGYSGFNIAIGENPALLFPKWTTSQKVIDYLINSEDPLFWGDIYAQFE